jgi:hypothetical protein
VIEFDLKQAWNMGLKDHVNTSQRSTGQVWMVKIYVKDGLVKKIENEFSGFVREDVTL